ARPSRPDPGGTGSAGRSLAGDGQQGTGRLRRPWLAADLRPFGTHPGHRTPPQTRPLARATPARLPSPREPLPRPRPCDLMIVASFRCYLTRTGHDHETEGAAAG